MTTSSEFVQMINHPRYEMMTKYPHTIRRIDNKREVKECEHSNGYFQVRLNDGDKRRTCLKHRLIAEQFLPNPDNLPQIDHINHNRQDNRIENLRWVSGSTNLFNRASYSAVQYEFVDDLPEDAIVIDFYETKTERREFELNKYYYYYNEDSNEDLFYGRIDDNMYKILYINTQRDGTRFVSLRDIYNRKVSVYINRFKYQHDLL